MPRNARKGRTHFGIAQGSARFANLNGVGRCREKASEMKVAALFRLTATVLIIQIALGGLVTFDFVSPLVHIGWGVVVVAVAIFTAAKTLRLKPLDRQLRGVSFGMVAGLAVQVILGFSALALSSEVLAWVHLVLGILIYAMALTGMSFAQRREYMSTAQGAPQPVA